MGTQIATITEFSKQLAGKKTQLQSLLPEGLTAERFMRTAVNGIQMHKDSEKLLKANRQTLFSACQKAAQDGLLLDSKEATLVVFGNEAVYMPMTQGLVKLARNSGEISTIDAFVVYEKDEFTYRPGIDTQPIYNPDWKIPPSQKGAPMLAYAVVGLKNGEKIVRIMHEERIMQIAAGGKNSAQYKPSSGKHFEEWWKKTVIKAALKYAPKSTHLESALDHDNEGYDFDPDNIPDAPARQSVDDINADLGVDTKTGEVIDGESEQVYDEANPPPISEEDLQDREPGDVI